MHGCWETMPLVLGGRAAPLPRGKWFVLTCYCCFCFLYILLFVGICVVFKFVCLLVYIFVQILSFKNQPEIHVVFVALQDMTIGEEVTFGYDADYLEKVRTKKGCFQVCGCNRTDCLMYTYCLYPPLPPSPSISTFSYLTIQKQLHPKLQTTPEVYLPFIITTPYS